MFDEMSSVTKGNVGLGIAIGYFCAKGIIVSIPLIDNQDYDLVIDIDGLKKVQVKTTGVKAPSGNFEVQIKSVRPNRTSNKIKNFDPEAVDYLFVLTSAGDKYLIPTSDVKSGSTLTLTKDRSRYIV